MLNTGIYRIRNIKNGVVYIGSSNNLSKRKKQHFSELAENRHVNKRLQSEYNEYGADKFVFETIEYTLASTRLEREQYWINHYKKNGKVYNTGTANVKEKTLIEKLMNVWRATWNAIEDEFL